MEQKNMILIILLAASIVFYFISWAFSASKSSRGIRKECKGTNDDFLLVYPSKLLIPSFLLLIMGIIFIFILDNTDPFPADAMVIGYITYVIIAVIFVGAAYICLRKVYNFSIHVKDDTISVYKGKNVNYSFTFAQITSIKKVSNGQNNESYKIKTSDGHKLQIGSNMISYDMFERKLQECCQNLL